MKKMLSLILLILSPSFIHAMPMEKTSIISSAVMKAIEKHNASKKHCIPISLGFISQSSDGSKIATYNNYGYISLWDGCSGVLLEEHLADYSCNKNKFLSMAFNENATRISVTTSQNLIEEYEIIDSKVLAAIKTQLKDPHIKRRSRSSDGSMIVTFNVYGCISLWNGYTGALLEEDVASYDNKNEVLSITFNKEGTTILVLTSNGTEDHQVIDSKVLTIIKQHDKYQPLKKRIQTRDKSLIVTLDIYGCICLWDGHTGDLLVKNIAGDEDDLTYYNKKEPISVEFNKEETKIHVTTPKGTEEHEIVNPQALKVINSTNVVSISKTCQNAEGTQIVTYDQQGYISLWDGKTGESLDQHLAEYPTFIGEKDKVHSIRFNNEGTKILVITAEEVKEHIIINPQAIRIIQQNSRYYYRKKNQSPDGSMIITFDHEGYISLWNGKTGDPLKMNFADYSDRDNTVLSIGFNDEGTKILVTTHDKIEEHPVVQEQDHLDKDTHELACSVQ